MMPWQRFWQRRKRDEDLAREIESYLSHEIEENIARGMSDEDARREAGRKFGNPTAVREQVFERNTFGLFESLWRDIALGIRQLRKNPSYACSGILILALGIGATTAIFSITYGVLLQDLPYDHPGRLVTLGSSQRQFGFQSAYAGAADYVDWRKHQQVFEELGLTRPVGNYNLTGAGEPERLEGARTTASVFSTLRASPYIGRVYTEEEQLDERKASSVAVLSYGLWKRRFGSDRGVIGRKILLNGSPHEVLGVMGPEFQYPAREFELWTPLYLPPASLKSRRDFSYLCVARLKPGVELERARSQMTILAANLTREHPQTNKDVTVFVGPMLSEMTGGVRKTLWMLLASVSVLFLAGCFNLANLALARGASRSRELAIRASLGATRSRLARQFFAEAIPLVVAGGGLGILAANWLLQVLIPMLPASTPRIDEIGLNGPVLLVSIVLSAATAFIVAVVPTAPARVRDLLIVTEIAFTVLLLVTAGSFVKTFYDLRSTNPGFETSQVLSLHLAVSRSQHGGDDGVSQYLGRLIERVRAVPGVQTAGIVNRLPFGGQMQAGAIRFEGRDESFNTDWRSASPDYFRSLSVPLVAGRSFTDNDSPERPAVGIIDERLAREAFGSESPVGRRFRMDFS